MIHRPDLRPFFPLAVLWALALVAITPVAARWAVPPAAAQTAGETAAPTAAPADQPRRVVIRFLTEGDYPPFNYLDEDGVLNGFNVDLARAICNEIGVACDIKVRPWDELLLALKRGDADAVVAGHTVTPDALAQVEFTERYFHTPGRFAAKSETPKTDIAPEALDGRSIAVARGSPHEAFLKTFFRDSRIVPFETPDLAREALLQGKTDYVFDDGIGLAFWINGTLSRRCCELRGGPYFEPRYFGDGLAIAVPRSDPQIKALINAALHKIRATGRFDELVSRYFPHRVF
jgi:polar amino acid transport system substrate-binding protein